MMAPAILSSLENMGIWVSLEGTTIHAGPKSALTDHACDLIRTHSKDLRLWLILSSVCIGAGLSPDDILSELTEEEQHELLNGQINKAELDALAYALTLTRLRESGRVPSHYTKATICGDCGPVWLWEGVPDYVEGCPWCFNRLKGYPIPRPHLQELAK